MHYIFLILTTISLAFASPTYAKGNKDVYEALDKDFNIINHNGINIENLSALYKKYDLNNASVYLRMAFMDAFNSYDLTIELIKRFSGDNYDCKLKMYDATSLMIKGNTQSIIDTYQLLENEYNSCTHLSTSDAIVIMSRILFATIQNPETRDSGIEKLINMQQINNIHKYSPFAAAYFYYVLAAGNMQVCLEKGYSDCENFEYWYPDLVRATHALTQESDHYPRVIFMYYIIDTVNSYSDKYNVLNPFQGLVTIESQ